MKQVEVIYEVRFLAEVDEEDDLKAIERAREISQQADIREFYITNEIGVKII